MALAARKTYLVWADGTNYYFNWNSVHDNPSGVYENIYGSTNEGLMLYTQVFRAAALIMITVFLFWLWRTKKVKTEHIFVLALLGMILFQCGWEANKKHSICYIPVMILMMECGFDSLGKMVTSIQNAVSISRQKIIKKVVISALAVLFAAMDIFILSGWTSYTRKENNFRSYSYQHLENRMETISDIANRKRVVCQTFATDSKFNRIGIRFSVKEKPSNAAYVVTLIKDNRICTRKNLTADMLKEKGWAYLKYKGEAGNYVIRIECPDFKKDSMEPFYMTAGEIPTYHNAGLKINGRTCRGAIDFNVFRKMKRVYTNDIAYGISFMIWILLQVCCIRGIIQILVKRDRYTV